jgi:hypothetical protein
MIAEVRLDFETPILQPRKKYLEHLNFLCISLGRHEDESGKAKNAANAIHCRVFSTQPDEAAIGISGCRIN